MLKSLMSSANCFSNAFSEDDRNRRLLGKNILQYLTGIKLPFFVLSFFEWPFCTGFTIHFSLSWLI